MIASSYFVAIAWLARKDPGTSLISSLLDPGAVYLSQHYRTVIVFFFEYHIQVLLWTLSCFSAKEIGTLCQISTLPWGNKISTLGAKSNHYSNKPFFNLMQKVIVHVHVCQSLYLTIITKDLRTFNLKQKYNSSLQLP